MSTLTVPEGTFVDFKELKARVSIIQILEHYDLLPTLNRTGDRLSGACPLHGGTNRTQFRVSVSKNCFNCFGHCGRGGNIIDFVSMKEGIPFRDAALLIQQWFVPEKAVPKTAENGPPRPPRPPHRVQSPPEDESPQSDSLTGDGDQSDDSEEAGENPPLSFELKSLKQDHPYLVERGLTPETIQRYGIGYCPKGCLRGYIAIPLRNFERDLVGYLGRWPGDPPDGKPKYKLPKGFKKNLELFNIDRAQHANPAQPLVIVEGVFDCLRLMQMGHDRTVALLGSKLSSRQQELIVSLVGVNGGKIAIMLDADDAGRAGAIEAAGRLAQHALVRIIELGTAIHQPERLEEHALRTLIRML